MTRVRPSNLFFESRGDIHVLALSRRRKEVAAAYFDQPIIREPDEKPDPDKTDWERGQISLDRLTGFDQDRGRYRNSMAALGDYLTARLFQRGRVLELGCGLGLKKNLVPGFKGKWVALDYDPLIVKEARLRDPQGTFVAGSAYALPFPDNSFETVYAHASLDVLTDLPAALAEIKRVLKPGGRLLHLMDVIPNKNVLGNELARRGFFIRVEGGGPESFFGLKGPESVRVLWQPGGGIFEGLDPLSSEWQRQFEALLRQIDKACAEVPVVTYSLLSAAFMLRALGNDPGFGRLEAGALTSIVPTEAENPPVVRFTSVEKLEAAIHDAPFWSWAARLLNFRLNNQLSVIDLMRRLRRPVRGIEVYTANYVVAEKVVDGLGKPLLAPEILIAPEETLADDSMPDNTLLPKPGERFHPTHPLWAARPLAATRGSLLARAVRMPGK